ncbi:hypothetical protein HDU67_008695 [Dinochytrium kinnereticum]|nr:hypothetical protein HDU67_008695 [Dinochytrium kinnereticum]
MLMAQPQLNKDSFSEMDLYNRHLATLDRVYSNMLASNKANNVLSRNRAVPVGTFSSNVVGRISPFGRMDSLDDTVDYFWGLFGSNSPRNTLQLFPEIVAYNISAFANTGSAGHALVELTTSARVQIRAQAMFLFEETPTGSTVSQYDITFVNMNSFFSTLHGELEKLDMIGKTCKAQRAICGNGLKDEWPLLNCEVALAFKSLGEAATFGSDTILCRAAEVNLAYLRKGVHCSNLGPSGGSKCVKRDYKDYFIPIGKPFTDTPSAKEAGNAELWKNYNEAKATVFNVYNKTIFPYNLEFVKKGIVPPRTFSNDTAGRIWPIGNFKNTEDTVEYQFGIFGSEDPRDIASGLIPVMQSFQISAYVNNGKVAATSIDYIMVSPVTKITYPLRVQGFWRMNSDYEVSNYDVFVHNSGRFNNEVALNTPAWLNKPALAAAICISQSFACTGKNQIYGGEGQGDCFTTLVGKVPAGDPNQVMSNSVQCRSIHVNLAFLRPDGGGKCHDHPYEEYFTYPFKESFMPF